LASSKANNLGLCNRLSHASRPLGIAAEIVDKKDGREMSAWTEYDLKRQFERAKKNSWIKTFKSAAATYQFPPEVLMAIASRETNMRNIWRPRLRRHANRRQKLSGVMQLWLMERSACRNPKGGPRPSQQATNHSEWAG
jgi:hypothetical protein